VRIAFLADIHANREALDAVLDRVDELAPDRIVLLGDIVGYGPDPEYAVEKAAEMAERGAICVKGNHDEAAVSGPRGMSENARVAAEWTMERLSAPHLRFLDSLPLVVRGDGRTYVHASADRPGEWPYVDDAEAAARCLAASGDAVVFCGHTHVPAVYYSLTGRKPVHHRPARNRDEPLLPTRRHVVVVGAVGQPRDGVPAACFGLLETDAATVAMLRVPYDFGTTLHKIREAGLPGWLGMRLKIGR
jgi:diadenosine tetraphosphatase ApaH/serine/threonine PP2A family protein phosphatase